MIGMVYDFLLSCSYWTAFILEMILLQSIVLYLLALIYTSKNIYYSLLHTTLLFFFFGSYLAFWQLDIYTGLIWMLELTIMFVCLLVLFYLNFKGFVVSVEDKDQYIHLYIVILAFILLIITCFSSTIFC